MDRCEPVAARSLDGSVYSVQCAQHPTKSTERGWTLAITHRGPTDEVAELDVPVRMEMANVLPEHLAGDRRSTAVVLVEASLPPEV